MVELLWNLSTTMKLLLLLISSIFATRATTKVDALQKRSKISRSGSIKSISATAATTSSANLAYFVTQQLAQPTALPGERSLKVTDDSAKVPAYVPSRFKRQRNKGGENAAIPFPSCSEGFLKGKTLNGKYSVEKTIGKGTFSVVFAAMNIYDGEIIALKCLTGTNDPSSNDEIATLKRLNHPNVVKMVDSFVEGGLRFIVTEMCDFDLETFIEIDKKLDLPTAKNIMLQIASAVVYLHNSQIFHRDLKPTNILVVKGIDKTYVKVSDFGLSTSEISSDDPFVGTPLFQAPEIYNERIGYPWAKNDVWAMGLIFFNMLTGHSPWIRPTFPEQTVTSWRLKYGFSENLAGLFQKTFNVSRARPTAEEFYQLISQL